MRPLRHEQPRDHLGGRALAVRAGDVDRPGTACCGSPIAVAQRGDVVERRRRDPPGLVVGGVLVEVRERVVVGHGSLRLRPGRGAAQEAALRWRPDDRGTSVGLTLSLHGVVVDDDLADVGATGQVVHRVEQHLFEDRPQPAGTGATQQRLIGDRLQAVRGELELDVFEARTPSRYCLTRLFFGSTRILTSASRSRLPTAPIIGRRPMNSGIMPNLTRSSGSTWANSSPGSRSTAERTVPWKPTPLWPMRLTR